MNIAEVYEKYKHLDLLLSDGEWMQPAGNEDSDKLARIMNHVCYDLWLAVKTEAEAPKREE